MAGTIQMGSASIKTDNSRDTLLILAGARLRVLSPERFAKYQETFSRWNDHGHRRCSADPAEIRRAPEVAAISKRMGTMRGLPTDARPHATGERAGPRDSRAARTAEARA